MQVVGQALQQAPDFWTQLGSALGGGMSSGLTMALTQALEEQQRRAQLARQLHDYQGLAQALGVNLPNLQLQSTQAVQKLPSIIDTLYSQQLRQKQMQAQQQKTMAQLLGRHRILNLFRQRNGLPPYKTPPSSPEEEALREKATFQRYGTISKEKLQRIDRKPKTPTPREAEHHITSLLRGLAIFDKEGIIDNALTAKYPSLANLAGQQSDPKARDRYFGAAKQEIMAWLPLTTPGYQRWFFKTYPSFRPTSKSTSTTPNYIFTREKGLVPASEAEVK